MSFKFAKYCEITCQDSHRIDRGRSYPGGSSFARITILGHHPADTSGTKQGGLKVKWMGEAETKAAYACRVGP